MQKLMFKDEESDTSTESRMESGSRNSDVC